MDSMICAMSLYCQGIFAGECKLSKQSALKYAFIFFLQHFFLDFLCWFKLNLCFCVESTLHHVAHDPLCTNITTDHGDTDYNNCDSSTQWEQIHGCPLTFFFVSVLQ